MYGSGETSIWKKEITFRRKPKGEKKDPGREETPKGHRVPPAPEPPAKPESVGELLRPLEETAPVFEPVAPPLDERTSAERPVLPPVSPPQPSAGTPGSAYTPPPVSPPGSTGAGERSAEPPAPDSTREEQDGGESPGEREPDEEDTAAEVVAEAPTEIVGAPAGDAVPAEPSGPVLPAETEKPAEQEPQEAKKPSRRERKAAKKEAERLAKEQRRQAEEQARRAKKLAKADRPADQHKRLVGLKVGGSQIAAAQVVNKGTPRVVKMARMPLERGVVVGGELREPEELTAALKTFFRKHKLPKGAVRLGISNNRIAVRTFELPGIDDPKQLANAIRFRAQETMPIPLDEAVLDHRILEERRREDGVTVRRVLLVVAHRELVDRYLGACKKAGLKLVGIDLEAFALLRALGESEAAPAAADDAGLVCVSIGHDRSTLAVSDGRVCEFTRVLAWGGSALDVAVSRVLDVTPSEAEPIKRSLSLLDQGEVPGLEPRRAEEARRAMRSEIQTFARELVSSLRFYQEQPGSLGIGEIQVTGGGAQCGGLAEELEKLIGVTVRVGDPLARVKVPRKLRKAGNGETGSLAIAVGLGIED